MDAVIVEHFAIDRATATVDDAWRRAVAASDGNAQFVRRRDQPLLISLSSGTTGAPK